MNAQPSGGGLPRLIGGLDVHIPLAVFPGGRYCYESFRQTRLLLFGPSESQT